ncbi:MAG: hypothetical protein ACTSYJ_05000 [Candidatus Thorarchaeota archaeon]
MTPEEFSIEKGDGKIGCRAEVVVKNNLQKKKVELHGLKAKIVIKVKDEEENVVSKSEFPANSFLLNFMRMLYTVFTASPITAKDTNGNDVSMKLTRVQKTQTYTVEYKTLQKQYEQAGFHAWAIKEDDTHGILIGIGTETVTPNDYQMSNKIPNGLESGKMLYLESSVGDLVVVGNSAHIELKRSFLNYSGATITLTEIGLAVKQFSPEANILVIRDQIEPTDVQNNYGVDVSYVIEVTV